MKNRWVVALAGFLVLLGPGAVYSFSLFSQPLIASFGWNTVTTTWAFALANFFLGMGAMLGGYLQDRVGPGPVALAGALLWGLGNAMAGYGTQLYGVTWLYATYGIIGGLGCGMAYIAAVSAVIKWFPKHRGFGGGLAVMGFGAGAFIYNLILRSIPQYTSVAKAASAYVAAQTAAANDHVPFNAASLALSPDAIQGIMNIFVWSGMAFIVAGGLFAMLVSNPPSGYGVVAGEPVQRSYTPREMMSSSQFYLLWIMLFLNVTAGIIIVSNAVPIMQELTALPVAMIAGAYAAIASFNAIGRLLWGAISDRIGRKTTFATIFAIQVVVFYFLDSFHDLRFVGIAFGIVLLCYGGGFGTMPAFNADCFGTKYFGSNYGLTLTAWGCAGIAGPWFVSTVKDFTGTYAGALQPVAVMLLVATIFPLIVEASASDEALKKTPIAKAT